MTNLIVISHEFDVEREILLVNELFNQGMQLFHLRKPVWDVDTQRHFLEQIKPEFREKISVHQHHETIEEFGLKYHHVKEKQRKDAKKEQGLIYSTSFHDPKIIEAEAPGFGYYFLSPVFDSISKKNYTAKFGDDFILNPNQPGKVFALGGVKKDNVAKVFERGFYGAAVLGAIWYDTESAIKNFKELDQVCKQNVHTF